MKPATDPLADTVVAFHARPPASDEVTRCVDVLGRHEAATRSTLQHTQAVDAAEQALTTCWHTDALATRVNAAKTEALPPVRRVRSRTRRSRVLVAGVLVATLVVSVLVVSVLVASRVRTDSHTPPDRMAAIPQAPASRSTRAPLTTLDRPPRPLTSSERVQLEHDAADALLRGDKAAALQSYRRLGAVTGGAAFVRLASALETKR